MNFLEQCQTLTLSDCKLKEDALELGQKFLESGFMDDSQRTKQYQFAFYDKKVYLYIWNFHTPSELLATICPYNSDFVFSCHFEEGQKTQPHVKDFL